MIQRTDENGYGIFLHTKPSLPEIKGEARVTYPWRKGMAGIRKGVDEVMKELERWFWMIENGTAVNALPNVRGKRYEREYVDRFIRVIDEYLDKEIHDFGPYHRDTGLYTKGKEIDKPADFNRLQGPAREAFVQAINDKMKEVGYLKD